MKKNLRPHKEKNSQKNSHIEKKASHKEKKVAKTPFIYKKKIV